MSQRTLWNPKKWVKERQPRPGAPVLPLYTVMRKFEEYEERAYPHTYWCTTLLHGIEPAKAIGLRRLMDYISGYNKRGERFHFSAPIVWTLSPRGEPISVSLYLGLGPKAMAGSNASSWPPPQPSHPSVDLELWPPIKSYVSRFMDSSNCCWWPAPEPNHPDVFVECWPAMIAYARMFRGPGSRQEWAREMLILVKNIPRIHQLSSYRMYCEYDDVSVPADRRRNEIWLLALA